MAFGRSKLTEGAPVTDITDWMVKSALQHEWFTLALSKFQNTFSTRHELGDYHLPTASGVVHFETGTDRNLRADLTFHSDDRDFRTGSIGGAHVHIMGEQPYVVFSVGVHDPRGKLAAQLQEAFHSAAVSRNRFVHVAFRRNKFDDINAKMIELGGGNGNAYHPISEMFVRRETILPEAPAWSWVWRNY